MVRTKHSAVAKAKTAELNALAEEGGFAFPTARELGVTNKPARKNKDGEIIKDGIDAPDCPCFSAEIDGIDWTEYNPTEIVDVLLQHPCMNTTLKGVCTRHDCKMNVVKYCSADSWNAHLEKYRQNSNFPLITHSANALRLSMAESMAEDIISQTAGVSVKLAQAKEKTAMKFVGSMKASASAYKEAVGKAESHFDSITADEKATIAEMMGSGSGSGKKGKLAIKHASPPLSLPDKDFSTLSITDQDELKKVKAELAKAKENENQLRNALEQVAHQKTEMAIKLAETELLAYDIKKKLADAELKLVDAELKKKETRNKLTDARQVANYLSNAGEEPYPGLYSEPNSQQIPSDDEDDEMQVDNKFRDE